MVIPHILAEEVLPLSGLSASRAAYAGQPRGQSQFSALSAWRRGRVSSSWQAMPLETCDAGDPPSVRAQKNLTIGRWLLGHHELSMAWASPWEVHVHKWLASDWVSRPPALRRYLVSLQKDLLNLDRSTKRCNSLCLDSGCRYYVGAFVRIAQRIARFCWLWIVWPRNCFWQVGEVALQSQTKEYGCTPRISEGSCKMGGPYQLRVELWAPYKWPYNWVSLGWKDSILKRPHFTPFPTVFFPLCGNSQ